MSKTTNTGLNTLSFIKENSLTYTEIMNDYAAFIGALTEDEKLAFKTLFEGTNSQILIELLSAKSSDEIYHIITSRSENLLYYANRLDSVTGIAQNNGYVVSRGSNIKLNITLTPSETVTLDKFSSIGLAEDYELIITENLSLTADVETTVSCYLGVVKEQTVIADTSDYLVFRFTNQNVSDQIALYLNDVEVPTSSHVLDLLNDKYFCMTNTYSSVDAIYLNDRDNATHKYANLDKLKLKYIEFEDITLSSIDIQSYYGTISSVRQESTTIQPENVASVRNNAPLYAESQNRIVARDDFATVLQTTNPELADANGHDYSNAVVEVTYVKKDGTFLTPVEYNNVYNDLSKRRGFGIPMCIISHPDVMYGLNMTIKLELLSGTSAVVEQYVKQVLSSYENKLGISINFIDLENAIESYSFVKAARAVINSEPFVADAYKAPGTTIKPTTSNGKLYMIRNIRSLTGDTEPTWNTTIGGTTTDGTIVWETEARARTPQATWLANAEQNLHSVVWSSSQPTLQFKCVGFTYATGATEPTWPTELGGFVVDNRILWLAIDKAVGTPVWTANTVVSKGDVVSSTTSSDFCYQAVGYVPKLPSTEPTWSTTSSLFTDGEITYAVINEQYDKIQVSGNSFDLNWNQYIKFNETVQVV